MSSTTYMVLQPHFVDFVDMAFQPTNSGPKSDIATCCSSAGLMDAKPGRGTKLQRSLKKIFVRPSPLAPPIPFNDQAASHFSRLPLELRQQIWELVLTRDASAKPAHFHVYDKVYDSCTHDPTSPALTDPDTRRLAKTTALLRKCHAIHDEAVQYLCDSTSFELVLLAGRPRPGHIFEADTPSHVIVDDNIRKRNCIGRLADLSVMLQRIRRATIVVQPGDSPDVRAYCQRVQIFLGAIDQGSRLRYLCLKLNFAERMVMKRHDALARIVESFLLLGEQQVTQSGRPKREIVLMSRSPVAQGNYHVYKEQIGMLQAKLHIRTDNVVFWYPSRDEANAPECAYRAAAWNYRFYSNPPKTGLSAAKEAAEMVGMAAILATVALPAIVFMYVRRKKDKGETWVGEQERNLFRRRR